MRFFVPHLAFLTFLWTISMVGQGPNSDVENELLAIGFEESILSNTLNLTDHATLYSAIKAADLDNILAFDGPFTVFAPSDKAFNILFENTGSNLLKTENKSDLQALLRYHIIAGKFTASSILKALCSGNGTATFMTIQGEALTATIQGIDIILTDSFGNSAKITTADTNRCNGVIHTIDSVILPKKMNYLP